MKPHTSKGIRAAANILARAGSTSRLTPPTIRRLVRALLRSEFEASHIDLRSSPMGLVFLDVVDFTQWTESNGDHAAVDLLDDLERSVLREIRIGKGKIIKRLGDGFFLAFPTASQAIRASLEMNRSILSSLEPRGLSARISVHTGRPVIWSDDIIGHDVNVTSRLLDNCPAGTIVVSEAAKTLAERRLRTVGFKFLGTVRLRGVERPCLLYAAKRVRRGKNRIPA